MYTSIFNINISIEHVNECNGFSTKRRVQSYALDLRADMKTLDPPSIYMIKKNQF